MIEVNQGTYWTQDALRGLIRQVITPVQQRLDSIADNIDVFKNGWGPYVRDKDYDALKSHITETATVAQRELEGNLLLNHMVWRPGTADLYKIENLHSSQLNATIEASCPGSALKENLKSFCSDSGADLSETREMDTSNWRLIDDHRFADYKVTNATTGEPFYFQYDDLEPTTIPVGKLTIKHTGDWLGVDNPNRPKPEEVQLTEAVAWIRECADQVDRFIPFPEMLKEEIASLTKLECEKVLQDGIAKGENYAKMLDRAQSLIQISNGDLKSIHSVPDVHGDLASIVVTLEHDTLPRLTSRLKEIQRIQTALMKDDFSQVGAHQSNRQFSMER